jgi:MerR family transcriptional regulator, light-induced transcriptional regulator
MANGVETQLSRHADGLVRIGELSRRVGVRPETLRAWERRYGLLEPGRSGGGYRLYSADDEARVRAMTALLARGISAAEAAKLAREAPKVAGESGPGATEAGRAASLTGAVLAVPLAPEVAGAGTSVSASVDRPVMNEAREQVLAALSGFDEQEANAILDRVLGRFTLEATLTGLVLPLLAEVGERWRSKQLTIAQEHFCTEILRARLLAIGRGWGGGSGPLALLACPPEERHDLGLIAFGLSLRQNGWRVAFLGPDTPIETVADAADRLDPAAVVVAAIDSLRFERTRATLRRIADRHALLVAGAGANPEVARSLGAAHLAGDPVEAARWVAREASPATV